MPNTYHVRVNFACEAEDADEAAEKFREWLCEGERTVEIIESPSGETFEREV